MNLKKEKLFYSLVGWAFFVFGLLVISEMKPSFELMAVVALCAVGTLYSISQMMISKSANK